MSESDEFKEFNLWHQSVIACEHFEVIICRTAFHDDDEWRPPDFEPPSIAPQEIEKLRSILGIERNLSQSDWRDVGNSEFNLNVSRDEPIDDNFAYRLGVALRRRVLKERRKDAESATIVKQENTKKTKRGIDARMRQVLEEKKLEAFAWTVEEWATHLDCAKSSVHATQCWKTIMDWKLANHNRRVGRQASKDDSGKLLDTGRDFNGQPGDDDDDD